MPPFSLWFFRTNHLRVHISCLASSGSREEIKNTSGKYVPLETGAQELMYAIFCVPWFSRKRSSYWLINPPVSFHMNNIFYFWKTVLWGLNSAWSNFFLIFSKTEKKGRNISYSCQLYSCHPILCIQNPCFSKWWSLFRKIELVIHK